MFVQTEATAEANTLRFLPGRPVLGSGTVEFRSREEAARSPLAARLFEVEGVAAVTLGTDWIAVGKAAAAHWDVLKPPVLGVIMEHLMSGRPALRPADEAPEEDFDPADSGAVERIKDVLDDRIRPALADAAPDGDIIFRGFRSGTCELELRGGGYRQPVLTVQVRIENTLRQAVPEVERARFVVAGRPEAGPELDLSDPDTAAVSALLEQRINPAVAAHGGRIALIDVRGDRAYIRLEGGCQGCGMADVTLKQGVERAIKAEVPTIAEVLDVTDHAAGTNPYYQPGKAGASPLAG